MGVLLDANFVAGRPVASRRITILVPAARESHNSDFDRENLHFVRQSLGMFLRLNRRPVVQLPTLNLLRGPVRSIGVEDERLRNLAHGSPSGDGFRMDTEDPSKRFLVNECLNRHGVG